MALVQTRYSYSEVARQFSLGSADNNGDEDDPEEIAAHLLTPLGASALYYTSPDVWSCVKRRATSVCLNSHTMQREYLIKALYEQYRIFNSHMHASLLSRLPTDRALARSAFSSSAKEASPTWLHGLLQCMLLDKFIWACEPQEGPDNRLLQQAFVRKVDTLPQHAANIFKLYTEWNNTLSMFSRNWSEYESMTTRSADDDADAECSGSNEVLTSLYRGTSESATKMHVSKVENNFCIAALGLVGLMLRYKHTQSQVSTHPPTVSGEHDEHTSPNGTESQGAPPHTPSCPPSVSDDHDEPNEHASLNGTESQGAQDSMAIVLANAGAHSAVRSRSVSHDGSIHGSSAAEGASDSSAGQPSIAQLLKQENDQLPDVIAGLEDFELLRPLYTLAAISPICLLSPYHVSSGSHSRVTLTALGQAVCQPFLQPDPNRRDVEHRLLNIVLDMAVKGRHEFHRQIGGTMKDWRQSGLINEANECAITVENRVSQLNWDEAYATQMKGPSIRLRIIDHLANLVTSVKKRRHAPFEIPLSCPSPEWFNAIDQDGASGQGNNKHHPNPSDDTPDTPAPTNGNKRPQKPVDRGLPEPGTPEPKPKKKNRSKPGKGNGKRSLSPQSDSHRNKKRPKKASAESSVEEWPSESEDEAVLDVHGNLRPRAIKNVFTLPEVWPMKKVFQKTAWKATFYIPHPQSEGVVTLNFRPPTVQAAIDSSFMEKMSMVFVSKWETKSVSVPTSSSSAQMFPSCFRRIKYDAGSNPSLFSGHTSSKSILRNMWLRLSPDHRRHLFARTNIHVCGMDATPLGGITEWSVMQLDRVVDLTTMRQCEVQTLQPTRNDYIDPKMKEYFVNGWNMRKISILQFLDNTLKMRKAEKEYQQKMAQAAQIMRQKGKPASHLQPPTFFCINILDIPLHEDLLEVEFDDGSRYISRDEDDYTYHTRLGPNALARRWMIIANAGAWSDWHIDASGYGTLLHASLGEHLVLFPKRKNAHPSSPSWPEDADIHCEPVLLRPGEDLYIRPAQDHAILTLSDGLCIGGHFYCDGNYIDTLSAMTYEHYVGAQVTNAEHPRSPLLLFKRLIALRSMYTDRKKLPLRIRIPPIDSLMALVLLVAHMDQLAPQLPPDGATEDIWQDTPQFHADFKYTMKALDDLIKNLREIDEQESNPPFHMNMLMELENDFVEMCSTFESAYGDEDSCGSPIRVLCICGLHDSEILRGAESDDGDTEA